VGYWEDRESTGKVGTAHGIFGKKKKKTKACIGPGPGRIHAAPADGTEIQVKVKEI